MSDEQEKDKKKARKEREKEEGKVPEPNRTYHMPVQWRKFVYFAKTIHCTGWGHGEAMKSSKVKSICWWKW